MAHAYHALPLEDYGLIGNAVTGALVGRNGSIDWFCPDRFDAPAAFAALVGNGDNGRWLLAPTGPITALRRQYRTNTLILETRYETATGVARVVDYMPIDGQRCHIIRDVEGVSGSVAMHMDLVARFDYGSLVPWTRSVEGGHLIIAGPDSLYLMTTVPLRLDEGISRANFVIHADQKVTFILSYQKSYQVTYVPPDPEHALRTTQQWWREWIAGSTYKGRYREVVARSLITLKALTCRPTGGVIAALTAGLPEQLGGQRNWDYRFCWLRDATFTLCAFLAAGLTDEAVAWREWLLRAVAGKPEDLQILYGVEGARRLTEWEAPWLSGYENARPVRIGNAAYGQYQLDVYGELMDSLHLARSAGLSPEPHAWDIQTALTTFLETHWQKPDEGIWEVRGGRRDFTYSKIMAWVAFDRAIKDMNRYQLKGPVARWTKIRDSIHKDVCARGFNTQKNAFTQYYGATELDASLLLLALVGFLPPDDPRVQGTVAAIQAELMVDGLVIRYRTEAGTDGLPTGEGVFLPCSFWLVDNLVLQNRHPEAEVLFNRLLGLCNDLGLVSEEYDTHHKRLIGNFPQALTHVALINSARNLSGADGPAARRSGHRNVNDCSEG